ncbi:MAG: RNA methyltransferase [Moorea sp. SIO2B7]|nr:RNA methyltransferase [Moorena sp. SIO2B7]
MLISLNNTLIKQIRKLHRGKERRKQNLFLLEGTHLLESALRADYPLVTVCCTPQWQQSNVQLWEESLQQAQRTELVTPELLKAIATTVNPDGVVATAIPQRRGLSLGEKIRLGLVLERLQDPGNLGTIIRTAVAANVDGLWLSDDSVDLENPKVLRASAGEWFRLPMSVSSDLKAVIQSYQAQGVQVVATLPQASKTYWEIDFRIPTLILLGNEGAGLSTDLVALAQEQVTIPLSSKVESLNVAIAAALLLYEAKRQKETGNTEILHQYKDI